MFKSSRFERTSELSPPSYKKIQQSEAIIKTQNICRRRRVEFECDDENLIYNFFPSTADV